jgi:O-antigen ligase
MMAIVLNVCFLMQGRSGYIALLISIAFCIFWQIKARYRILAPLLPILIGITLFFVSNNFHQRVSKVGSELSSFGAGNIRTSVGTRLEFWTRSVQAIQIKPLVGFGVGSWPYAYKLVVSNDTGIEGANNPHEQFLLWTVEGGCVALILLICFYASIFKDASSIQELEVSRSLKIIFFILLVVSLFNCPLHGAGMSEFFCIIIALMLCMKKNMAPANNS